MNGISIEEKLREPLYIELKIKVDKELVQRAFEQKLAEARPNINMKGFRNGRVPIKLIAEVHGPALWKEFTPNFIKRINAHAVEDQNLEVAGGSKIEIEYFSPSEGLEYLLSWNLKPKINPIDFSSLPPLEKPIIKGEVSDKEMEDKLKSICQKRKRIRPVQGRTVIQKGDVLVADLDVRVYGSKKFVVKPVKNSAIELIDKIEVLPTFNAQLIGKKTGKHKFVIQMPSHHPDNPDLASKKLDCSVNVREIRENYEYSPDDVLAKELGFDSFGELKKALVPEIEKERAEKSEVVLRRNAIFALWKAQSFEAPTRMVDAELEQIRIEDSENSLKDSDREVAEYRVQTGLILNGFASRYGIRVSEEELNQAIQNNDQFRHIPSEQVAAWIFEQKSLRALISQCEIKELEVSPGEFAEIEDQDLRFLKSNSTLQKDKKDKETASNVDTKAKPEEEIGESKPENKEG